MAKATTTSTATPEEKMAPPSITVLPENKSPTNGHSSPARTGKTTPSNTEKKPQINGHASPLHGQANISNKATTEGYMKTDDRMRLAKERREERERSLAAREQMIKEKERRAQLQYERTVEERCRRLEEQRHKEELRRAAVEEKRRQQLEVERERLEALMKKSLERTFQLEQRSRRWGRGYPGGAGDSENASLPSAASAFPHGIASPIPAVSESAPCSPHRSPYRADHSRLTLQGGSQSTPNTPRKYLRKDRTGSPGYGSPLRRSESPAAVKHTTSSTSKLVPKMRTQSPNNLHQNQNSPSRHPANLSKDGKKAGEKLSKTDSPHKNNMNAKAHQNSLDPNTKAASNAKSINTDTNERRNQTLQGAKPIVSDQEGDKKKATTTNEEEATRLLAERRRQARAQKEQEDKKRAQEADRLKEEQLKKPVAQQQDSKTEVTKVENHVPKKEDKLREANGENEQMIHNGKEVKPKELTDDTGRQQQERDLQKQQEEEERQLRKKRIEEIMKRTRKGEGDQKVEGSAGSDTGDTPVAVDTNTQVMEKIEKKFEAQTKSQTNSQTKIADNTLVKKEEVSALQSENHNSVKNFPGQATHSVPVIKKELLKPEEHQTQKSKESKASEPKTDKQCNANMKTTQQLVKESTKMVKREGSHITTEVSTQQTLHVSKAEVKEGSQDRGTKPTVTSLPLGQLTPPVIKLAPLDVTGTGSGDEVQSMEVSPASKEELISIPEFSPVNDSLNSGLSNSRALEDLMDLTGSVTYARLSPQNHIEDCNQNLIQGIVSPGSDSKLVGKSSPSSNKLSIK